MELTYPIIILCFSFILLLINVNGASDVVPKDHILLNCGSFGSNTTDTNNRVWSSDKGFKFLPSTKDTFRATARTQSPEVSKTPYTSARIMLSNTTYTFTNISSGRKFVRFYFYPNVYSRSNSSNAVFSIVANTYTLVRNFNVYTTTQKHNVEYLIKEYYINVEEGGGLNITFVPLMSGNSNKKSFAFVNGIEVVSVPSVYDNDAGVEIVGANSPFEIDRYTTLESLYRFNVGGNYISPANDTGLFRSWYNDKPYVYGVITGSTSDADPDINITFPNSLPSYTAPVDLYSTAAFMTPDNMLNLKFNLTWLLPVDTGFAYLVRLHFCGIFSNIDKVNQIVFNIYLNNQTAFPGFDLIALTDNNGIPYIMDFVMILPTTTDLQQADLWLALQPETSDKPEYYNAFLNGLEVFKINNTDGSLAPSTLSN